uniref:BTB domain-containing protein n=1 Tax=Caenorhabditis japonica TaxID=281687 RepID=A0A8R1HYU9_CAEJA
MNEEVPLIESPTKLTIEPVPNGTIARTSSEIVFVNVGGRRARLNLDLVTRRLATSRLAVFAEKTHVERLTDCDAYFESSSEYYFERSPIIFEYVVDFYITGKLHRPMDICPIRLRYELDYWRIPTMFMSPCCILEENNNIAKISTEKAYADSSLPSSCFDKVVFGPQRLKLYRIMENPRSSSGAKFFSVGSAVFVLLSLLGLILSSMPELQDENKEPHYLLHWLELFCMVYFTFEYLARLLVNPKKAEFIRSPLNVIDLLTVLPFMIEAFNELQWMKEFRGAMLVVRVMRLARVARIFKLARYSTGLRAFGETMKKSAAELSMLGMFLVTGIMLFSTAIYFFERDEPNSKFYSIPAACWWCVITMTTVGYGDLVPITAGGKVVAALASVCGIIVLAFPISMIIDKFAESTGGWSGGDLDEEQGGLHSRRTSHMNGIGGPNGGGPPVKKKSKRYVGF